MKTAKAGVKGRALSTAKSTVPRSLGHGALTRAIKPPLSKPQEVASASECSSLAPYWIPDEIKHYFVHRHSPNPEDEDDDTRRIDKALREIGLERELPTDEYSGRPWWRELCSSLPQYALLMIIAAATAVVVALLFGAVIAEFHSGVPRYGHVATVMIAPPKEEMPRPAGHGAFADEIHSDLLMPVPQYEDSTEKNVDQFTDLDLRPATREGDMGAPDKMSLEDRGQYRKYAADSGDEEMEVNKKELRSPNGYKFTEGSFDFTKNRDIDGVSSSLPKGVPRRRIPQAKIPQEIKLACQTAPVFTFCSSSAIEYFYDHARNACLTSTPNKLGVCNRGPNRFSSKKNCWRRCIDGRTTGPECRLEAVFGECHARDLVRTWWYSDGKRCRRWHFPNGRCPSGGSDVVFRTSADCAHRCSRRMWRRPCRAPKPVICDSKHLRFSYYADGGSGDHRPRSCRQLSGPGGREHYCLAGANRFPTLEACQKTCPWRYGVSKFLHTHAAYGERSSEVFVTPRFEGF